MKKIEKFLIEILYQNIPSDSQENNDIILKNAMYEYLHNVLCMKNIEYSVNISCRRIVIVVENISNAVMVQTMPIKGPKTSAPKIAINKFMEKHSITSEELVVKCIKGSDYYYTESREVSVSIESIAQTIIDIVIHSVKWKKELICPNTGIKWIRPINKVMCIHGNNSISIKLGKLLSSKKYFYGIRNSNHNGNIIENVNDYLYMIKKDGIILDFNERKSAIKVIIEKTLQYQKNLEIIYNNKFLEFESLLSEITGLVEVPYTIIAKIDLDVITGVPEELAILVMRHHQKFIPLWNKNTKKLSDNFIVIVDNASYDIDIDNIKKGNELVLLARMCDAQFDWDIDINTSLDIYKSRLKNIVFHEGIGFLDNHINRIESIAMCIHKYTANNTVDLEELKIAANLSKIDMASKTTCEYPELLGIVSGYIAKNLGYNDKIVNSISKHVLPKYKNDALPTQYIAIIISLADKINCLIGFILLKKMPTASKDPYGVRRQAMLIVAIIINCSIDISLKQIFQECIKLYLTQHDLQFSSENPEYPIILIEKFFKDKLLSYCKEMNIINTDILDNCITQNENLEIVKCIKKGKIIENFINSEHGKQILITFKRLIKFKESDSGNKNSDKSIDEGLFENNYEYNLFNVINNHIASNIERNTQDFEIIMLEKAQIMKLLSPINAFLDNVTINCTDVEISNNRYCTIKKCLEIFRLHADFEEMLKFF